ncbi:MAG TPA: hypothetical protein VFC78_09995 [Tepidisphaeraceae bacterium]|nr:hypothetical protein [Tepidisphaeraceae bacterium]
MLKYTLMLAIAVGVAGCGPKNGGGAGGDKMTTQAPGPTELAAYAGHAVYPANQTATNDLQTAAIVTSSRDTLKIYNFSGHALRNVEVWVNGAFVQHISGIPAQGSVSVKSSDLYNGLGKNFAGQKEPFSKVQLKTPDGFYNAWGPAAE